VQLKDLAHLMSVTLKDSEDLARIGIPDPYCGIEGTRDHVAVGESFYAGDFLLMNPIQNFLELILRRVFDDLTVHVLRPLAKFLLKFREIYGIIDELLNLTL